MQRVSVTLERERKREHRNSSSVGGLGLPTMPRQNVGILESAAENVQSRSHSHVHLALALRRDEVQVLQSPGATSIRGRNGRALPQKPDEVRVDAGLQALHVDGVHQKLAARRRQALQGLGAEECTWGTA